MLKKNILVRVDNCVNQIITTGSFWAAVLQQMFYPVPREPLLDFFGYFEFHVFHMKFNLHAA